MFLSIIETNSEGLVSRRWSRWAVDIDSYRVVDLILEINCSLFGEIKVLLFNTTFSCLPSYQNIVGRLIFFILDWLLPAGIDHNHVFASKFSRFVCRGFFFVVFDDFLWVVEWVCFKICPFLLVSFRFTSLVKTWRRRILIGRVHETILWVFKTISEWSC